MPQRAYEIGNRKFGVELEVVYHRTMNDLADALRAAGIEVASVSYYGDAHAQRPTWKIVTDGSVSRGFEVVSPILSGEEGLAEVARVCRALVEAGATVDRSTGLHVHFDAADLSATHIARFLGFYAKHEDSIDLLVAESRRANSNRYTESLVRGPGRTFTDRVNDFLAKMRLAAQRETASGRADAIAFLARTVFSGSRYFKVNVQSLYRHGTVEIRQHQGTVNAAKVVAWVRLCGAMISRAVASDTLRARVDRPGQDAHFRLKWLFNDTTTGETRRFFSRRARELRRADGARTNRAAMLPAAVSA